MRLGSRRRSGAPQKSAVQNIPTDHAQRSLVSGILPCRRPEKNPSKAGSEASVTAGDRQTAVGEPEVSAPEVVTAGEESPA